MIWGLSLAFRSNEEIVKIGGLSLHTFVPVRFTLDKFGRLFPAVELPRPRRDPVRLACVTVLSLFINSLAAYAFAADGVPGARTSRSP